jgi:hypothetical protein
MKPIATLTLSLPLALALFAIGCAAPESSESEPQNGVSEASGTASSELTAEQAAKEAANKCKQARSAQCGTENCGRQVEFDIAVACEGKSVERCALAQEQKNPNNQKKYCDAGTQFVQSVCVYHTRPRKCSTPNCAKGLEDAIKACRP